MVSEQERPLRVQTPSWLGRRLELHIESIAHGGHCVARHEGRVVFVRHTLPGEVVLAVITEDAGGSFCRADAVQIRTAAAARVAPRCPYAHPGGCGGCDFQHVDLAAQRRLKADVVAEQLQRLAGLEWPVTVDELGGHNAERDGLGWRRRVRFAVAPNGQLGLRAHRSHSVVVLDHCPIGAPGVGNSSVLDARWVGVDEVEVATDDQGAVAVLSHREVPVRQSSRPARQGKQQGKQQARTTRTRTSTEHVAGPEQLSYAAAERTFEVSAGGFWQTHPRAAEVFTQSVLDAAELEPGEKALDLYAGSGLFTAALAGAVGATGRVVGLEAAGGAVADAGGNLADLPWAEVRRAGVTAIAVAATVAELAGVDVVVLDPPRTGAGREVMSAMLSARPRVLVYVACDPAALARDIGTAIEAGWRLDGLRAFDAFPMTHHVECIAVLRPGA